MINWHFSILIFNFPTMKHQVCIIEDNKSISESLRLFIEAKSSINVLGEFGSVEEFLSFNFLNEKPNLLLLDIGLPGMSGLEGIPKILAKIPELSITMLTTYEEDDKIYQALCAGACSYISKKTPLAKIVEGLIVVSNGGSYMSPSIARKVATFFAKQKDSTEKANLSPRQKEIVEHMVEGKTYKEVADLCYISMNTVRSHIKKIYDVLQINSKVGLMTKYHRGEI